MVLYFGPQPKSFYNCRAPIHRTEVTALLSTFLTSYFSEFVRFSQFLRSSRRGGRRRGRAGGRVGGWRFGAAAGSGPPAATNAKIENEGKEGVRTPGHPDARASGRPSVRTSERPGVRASERASVRACERPSVRASRSVWLSNISVKQH